MSCRPFRQWRRAASLAILLALAPLAQAGESIEWLYIDANAGGSSGGHVAVKLGETVYHFQNDDGYTRLTRENWVRFRFLYNVVDNRNIHLARVPVRPADAERIRDRLSLLYLVQNRHVDFLRALEADVRLLDHLQQGLPAAMPGVGFFRQRAHESAALGELRERITQQQGAAFIARERRRLARQLAALRYAPASSGDAELSPDHYPVYPPTFAEQAQDLHAGWFALSAIDAGWPLRDDLLIDAGQLAGAGPERPWLSQYRESLRQAILQMLGTPYPGSGKALLLSLARYEALSLSLDSGRLLLLDTLPHPPASVRQPLSEADREPLQRLLRQLEKHLPALRQALLQGPEPDEAAYHRLEIAAAEWRETARGLDQGYALQLNAGEGPPEGWGYAVLALSSVSPAAAGAARAMAQARATAFLNQLRSVHGYQLVTRNCVTELARALNSSFTHQDETGALGGHLEPGAAQGFVPFRFFELVRQRYRVVGIATLPSYRNRQLARLSGNGADWAVLAREATTLTSTVYRPREGDSAFLLFTEHGFWTRPLFGVVNLGYGLGAATAGLFTIPADRGALLREGLRGVLFSLPELGFWNIRKGSFNEMSPRQDE